MDIDNSREITLRFVESVNTLGISWYQVIKISGMSRGTIYDIKNGKNNVTLKLIVPLIKEYPCININYILFSEGKVVEENVYTSLSMIKEEMVLLKAQRDDLIKKLDKEILMSNLLMEKLNKI